MKRAFLFFAGLLLPGMPAKASTLTATRGLSFGTLIPLAAAGSVTISLSGSMTSSGVALAPSGTTYYQGLMNFTGTGLGVLLEVVTISLLNNNATLTNAQTGTTLMANDLTTTNTINVNLLNPSVNNIPVGGKLTFSSTPAGGTYAGSVQARAYSLLLGTSTTTVPITVTFWSALQISQTTALNFGGIEVLSGNATLRVAAATGARTVVSGAGGINLISTAGSSAGQFNVSGEPGKNISVTLPSSTTLTGSRGGTMTVNNFTGSPGSSTLTLDTGGSAVLKVGADLIIGAAQTPGVYTGTYTVTVNY